MPQFVPVPIVPQVFPQVVPPLAAHMGAPIAPMPVAQTNYAVAASSMPEFTAAPPPVEYVWAQPPESEAAGGMFTQQAALPVAPPPHPHPHPHPQLQAVEVTPAVVEVAAVVVPHDTKGDAAKRKRPARTETAESEGGFKPALLPKLPRTKTKRMPAVTAGSEGGREPPGAARKRSVTQQSYLGPRRFLSPFCNCEVHLATNRGGLFNLSHRIIHQQPDTTCDSMRFCLRKQYEISAMKKPQQRVTLYVSNASGLVNLRALFSSEDVLDSVTTSATVERLMPGALCKP